jgi:Peptidase_C39 like family
VQSVNQASLSNIEGLFINTINEKRFHSECSYDFNKLPSIWLQEVPKKSQRLLNHSKSKEMCSPTSLSMLTEYLSGLSTNPLDVAKNVYDDGLQVYGSWPFNTAYAFELCKGSHYLFVQRLNSFKDLHQLLVSHIPVIVSVRGELKGAQKPYKNGHLLLVVGWDQNKKYVICHDPAFYTNEATLSRYHINDFIPAWERSRRLSYVAEVARL